MHEIAILLVRKEDSFIPLEKDEDEWDVFCEKYLFASLSIQPGGGSYTGTFAGAESRSGSIEKVGGFIRRVAAFALHFFLFTITTS